jgi:hypothetical protein
MVTWTEDVVSALRNLGGRAHLSDIYAEIRRIRPTERHTQNLEARVRDALERSSSDSDLWERHGSRRDLFHMVARGTGVWELRGKVH